MDARVRKKSAPPGRRAPPPRMAELADTSELAGTAEPEDTSEPGGTPELGDTPELFVIARTASARPARVGAASGDDVLRMARAHLGERYVLGARAPMANPDWTGPWDCAEFVSWCVFRASGVLYGTQPRHDPMLADAFTGFWADQAEAGRHMVSIEAAAAIAGAVVLRKPAAGRIGHIVLSDGRGGTVEAHSRARGVVADTLSGRRWDFGVLVPGLRYFRNDVPVDVAPPPASVLRLTQPAMRGAAVQFVQQRLLELGLPVGRADGIFGPQTAHAVRLFQDSRGLVADGEVGPATLAALRGG